MRYQNDAIKKIGSMFFMLFISFQIITPQEAIQTFSVEVIPNTDYTAFITQTDDGFYWFGNSKGLYRYDGTLIEHYTIHDPSSDIIHDQNVQSKVYEDHNQKLWFSTYSALHALDLQLGQVSSYQFNDVYENLIQEEYRCFHFDSSSQSIWLRAGDHLWEFNTLTNEYKTLSGETKSVDFKVQQLTDNKIIRIWGSPWFNGKGIELFTYSPSSAQIEFQLLPIDQLVIDIEPISDDTVYVSTMSGIKKLIWNQDNLGFEELPIIQGNSCYALLTDKRSKKIWASEGGVGLYTFNESNEGVNILSHSLSDAPMKINSDQSGNIWLSYLKKGINLITKNTFGQKKLPLDFIPAGLVINTGNVFFLSDQGNLLFTNLNNLEKIDAPIEKLGFNVNLNDEISRLHIRNNIIYILGQKKIAIYNILMQEKLHKELIRFPSQGLFSSKDGTTIILTANGIKEVKITTDSIQLSTCNDFSAYKADDFLTITSLTDSSFILSYHGVEAWLSTYKENKFSIKNKAYVGSELTVSIKGNNDTIWLGTSNGLHLMTDTGCERIFSGGEKFKDIWVNAMIQDKYQNLWLGTKQGLFCYNPYTSKSIYYSKKDGLTSEYFAKTAPIALPDGQLLFTHSEGCFIFDPIIAQDTLSFSQPYISDLLINNIPYEKRNPIYLESLDLSYNENTLSFRISTKELNPSAFSGVSYQMLNYEDQATFIEAGGVARYPKLPPGKYQFLIQGINRNGITTAQKKIDVIIHPPFYLTWWFKLLAALAILSLIGGGYLILLRREIAKQKRIRANQARISKERERIAAELHDDIGGNLASILYLADGVRYAKSQGIEMEVDVDRIHELTDESIKNMREIIWVLDDEHSTVSLLAEQLCQLARNFASSINIQVQFDIQNNLPDIHLSSLEKRNVLLICKEAFQNIRKHAKASSFT
ncbi:MAG: histidine kinase, partial [Chitinophagales bacterium]|nr:histidine kinase [Chitinophagales bacterium]